MTQFDERLEGEMKTHDAEMIRKALIKKYGGKPLIDRINYVISIYHHDAWTASEMYAKLEEIGLNQPNTEDDVKALFTNPENNFGVKVVG